MCDFAFLRITEARNNLPGGDLSYDTVDYDSIFAIAMLLFIMTLMLNLISRWIVRRFRQEY